MVSIEERCYKLYRIIFTVMGLWPYQKRNISRIQAVFFFVVYFCFAFFQLTSMFMAKCVNVDCNIKKLSYFSITFIYIISYCSFYFNTEIIKQSFEHIQLDWKTFENSKEMKIMQKYIFEAYIFALTACILITFAFLILTTFECRSIIFDIIVPLNKSRPRKVEIPFEFFIDEEQYFFLHLIQEFVGATTGILSLNITFIYLTLIGKHCCAMYKIASYLLENTVTVHTLQIPIFQRIHLMHQNICRSVYIHRRTMKFLNDIITSFNFWYFPLVLIGVVSLSCILFRLHNCIIELNNYYDILMSSLIFYFHLAVMFVLNFLMQCVIDHSTEIFKAIYDTCWYIAPLPIQKLLLIMQKSIKDHKVLIGGLFVPSIEGFSTLITSAVSYFTVMHAIR